MSRSMNICSKIVIKVASESVVSCIHVHVLIKFKLSSSFMHCVTPLNYESRDEIIFELLIISMNTI